MRFSSLFRRVFVPAGVLSVLLAVAACQSGSQTAGQEDDFESDIVLEPVDPDAARQRDVAKDVEALAGELQAELSQQPQTAPAPAAEIDRDVRWLVLPRPKPTVVTPAPAAGIAQAPMRLEPDVAAGETTIHPVKAEPAVLRPEMVAPSPVASDRAALLHDLRASIRDSEGDPLARGGAMALLAAIDPATPFDPAAMPELSAPQQQRLAQYQKLVQVLSQQLAREDAPLDLASIQARYDDLLGHRPIGIRTVKLVRGVSSFGVYDEFGDNRFLAGQSNSMIVYVELDDFQSQESADGRHVVKLAQEVELYTDPSGTLVWAQPREELLDESRNRRRDFFVRQLIKLPANLSVGEYLIKVRVFDVNAGTVAERSVPIVLVADQRMVREK